MNAGTPLPPPLPIPMPSFLEGNPYFQAGFGLAVMGFGMQLLRKGGIGLQIFAKRQFLTSLEITNRDASFPWITQWLQSTTNGKLRRVTVETTKRQTQSGKSITSYSLVPSQGKHFVQYKGTYLMVERDRELRAKGSDSNSGDGSNVWESIKFTTIGRDPSIFDHIMHEAQQIATNKDLDYTTIYTSWGHNGWKPFGNPRRKRDISSVILDHGIQEAVINDIYEFLTCKQWYFERGIPYRRGYLLYGEPGSGKSSFVSAIAGHIGYDICVMSLAQPGLTDDHLAISLINVPEKSLILFEDIDCLFYDRAKHDDSEDHMRKKHGGISSVRHNPNNYMSFSGFLNALDGVNAGEERIVFMTTNYVQELDSALIRPGRIDTMQYFGYATPFQIEQMFYRFYPELRLNTEDLIQYKDGIDAFVKVLDGKGISMAELQEYFLLHKDNIETALNDAQVFVDTLLNSPRRKGVNTLDHVNRNALEGVEILHPNPTTPKAF
eukprot:128123_1